MPRFCIQFVHELAKSSFGSVKTLLSQMGFIQTGFCFISNCPFFSPQKNPQPIQALKFLSPFLIAYKRKRE